MELVVVEHGPLLTGLVVQLDSLIGHRWPYLSCQNFQVDQTQEVESQGVPQGNRFGLHQSPHSKLSQVPVSAVRVGELGNRRSGLVQLLVFGIGHSSAERRVLIGVPSLARVGIFAIFYELAGTRHRRDDLRPIDLGRGDGLLCCIGRIDESVRRRLAIV